MTTVTYDEATRIYPGTDQAAVDHLDLEIAAGELLALVRPSGSGNSTALRMLAALDPLEGGPIRTEDRLGVTTVYVTHDQVEAMTMGDRVAVLKDGVLQQCAAPSELYHRPDNIFVAGFIGSPAMNLIPIDNQRPLRIADCEVALDSSV